MRLLPLNQQTSNSSGFIVFKCSWTHDHTLVCSVHVASTSCPSVRPSWDEGFPPLWFFLRLIYFLTCGGILSYSGSKRFSSQIHWRFSSKSVTFLLKERIKRKRSFHKLLMFGHIQTTTTVIQFEEPLKVTARYSHDSMLCRWLFQYLCCTKRVRHREEEAAVSD